MTLLGRVTFGGHIRRKINKLGKHCTSVPGNVIYGHADSRRQLRHKREKLPYLGNAITLPWTLRRASEGPQLPYLH